MLLLEFTVISARVLVNFWVRHCLPLRGLTSLYKEPVHPSYDREEKEARGPTLHHVSRVLSVVLMGRDTGYLHLLTPNLLTGGKRADLVIRGNVVLNKDDVCRVLYIYSTTITVGSRTIADKISYLCAIIIGFRPSANSDNSGITTDSCLKLTTHPPTVHCWLLSPKLFLLAVIKTASRTHYCPGTGSIVSYASRVCATRFRSPACHVY